MSCAARSCGLRPARQRPAVRDPRALSAADTSVVLVVLEIRRLAVLIAELGCRPDLLLDSATRTARLFSFTDCTTPAGSNRFVPDSHDAVSTTMYAQPGRALTSSIVPITPS